MQMMAFVAIGGGAANAFSEQSARSATRTPSASSPRVRRARMCAGPTNSLGPAEAIRRWKLARGMKPVELDEKKKSMSILFLCDNCWRAVYAEKQLMKQAVQRGLQDRLLVLSAGFDTKPGAPLPTEIIEQAARHGVPLEEEKPCASFDIMTDLDMHDYIFCLDRRIRDKLLLRAEHIAQKHSYDYAQWEPKLRLMKDINGDKSLTKTAWELDVSKFNTVDNETVMQDIERSCGELLEVLQQRGL